MGNSLKPAKNLWSILLRGPEGAVLGWRGREDEGSAGRSLLEHGLGAHRHLAHIRCVSSIIAAADWVDKGTDLCDYTSSALLLVVTLGGPSDTSTLNGGSAAKLCASVTLLLARASREVSNTSESCNTKNSGLSNSSSQEPQMQKAGF